jgi:hypothetical protein
MQIEGVSKKNTLKVNLIFDKNITYSSLRKSSVLKIRNKPKSMLAMIIYVLRLYINEDQRNNEIYAKVKL